MRPRLSVTIATFRRRALLEQVIRAVERQTIPADQYEVIVCDSGSGDGTAEMMTALMAEYPNLRYVDLAVNTLAAKRKAGLRAARAELVTFLDDDAVPQPEFVAWNLEAHRPGGDGGSGVQLALLSFILWGGGPQAVTA